MNGLDLAKWAAVVLTVGGIVFAAGILKSELDHNTAAIAELQRDVRFLRSQLWRAQQPRPAPSPSSDQP